MVVFFLNLLMGVLSVLLILIILVQRGRGGGLAGALGGVGGSSAFGTRAGDVFTKITVGVFLCWLLVGMIMVPAMTDKSRYDNTGSASSITDDEGDAKKPSDTGFGPNVKLPDDLNQFEDEKSKDTKKDDNKDGKSTESETKKKDDVKAVKDKSGDESKDKKSKTPEPKAPDAKKSADPKADEKKAPPADKPKAAATPDPKTPTKK